MKIVKTLMLLTICVTSIALADDFKTVKGKEYKDATVSRVEPDGIVVRSKLGISKIYFIELPKEIQERFQYDAQKANAQLQQQNANQPVTYVSPISGDTITHDPTTGVQRHVSPVSGITVSYGATNFVQTPANVGHILVSPEQIASRNDPAPIYLVEVDYYGKHWLSMEGDLRMNLDGRVDSMPMWARRPPKREILKDMTSEPYHELLTYITDRGQLERIANANRVVMQINGPVLTFTPENVAVFRMFLNATNQ